MTSNATVMRLELESLHRRENEMYVLYGEMLGNLTDKDVREVISRIRNDELGHIEMANTILNLLGDYLSNA